jgi:hypothetical protein
MTLADLGSFLWAREMTLREQIMLVSPGVSTTWVVSEQLARTLSQKVPAARTIAQLMTTKRDH